MVAGAGDIMTRKMDRDPVFQRVPSTCSSRHVNWPLKYDVAFRMESVGRITTLARDLGNITCNKSSCTPDETL